MYLSIAIGLLALGAEPPEQGLGVNLGFHVSSSSHLMFVDAMKRARPWVPFVPGSNFDSGVTVPVGRTGMPLEVPFVPADGGPPQLVRTVVFNDMDGRYPSGRYVLEFSGRGTVVVQGDVPRRVFRRPGRHPIEVTPKSEGLVIELRKSDKGNPLRGLMLWLPGFVGARQSLHPDMIRRLEGFSVLRVTQTMGVHHGDYPCDKDVPSQDPACVQGWTVRTKPQDFTQYTPRGVGVEYLAVLANKAGADFWPGIPHAADDDWVRRLARLLARRLEPDRKVFIELSNEIWNFGGNYPQHDYFRAIGRRDRLYAKDFDQDDTDAGRRAYVRRATQVWGIFIDEFGAEARSRLVKVMPGFFSNPWHSERMLIHLRDRALNPRGLRADGLAVGAYFAGTVADGLVADGRAKSATVEEVLERSEATIGTASDQPGVETFAGLTKAHAAIARSYGVSLMAYGGGQHLRVGNGRPSPINRTLHAANRHPAMGELYRKMFDLWFDGGGRLFVVDNFTQAYDDRGAFGHLEYFDQPYDEAPKFQALRDRMAAFGVELSSSGDAAALGVPWTYARTGVFPAAGVLIPLEAVTASAAAPRN